MTSDLDAPCGVGETPSALWAHGISRGAYAVVARAKPASSACASAISGNSGIGEKPFESGRKDGAGVGGAGGRLVKLGEHERRAQAPTARALLLCDGEGGLERFLRAGLIAGIELEQDFAAQEMCEREIATIFNLAREDRRRP